jgi:hypothetical protein
MTTEAVKLKQRHEEFEEVLCRVSRAPHPKLPYAELLTSDLLEIHLYNRLICHQLSYMILLRSFAAGLRQGLLPEPIVRAGGLSIKDVFNWGDQLTEETLFEAYCTYPNAALIGLMADTKMEEIIIGSEVAKRLEHNPAGRAFFVLGSFSDEEDWLQEDRKQQVSNLERALNVRHLNRYVSRDRPMEEIRGDALAAAFDVWHKAERDHGIGASCPPFPMPHEDLLPAEQEFWTGTLSQSWARAKQTFVTETTPILDVPTETIRKTVRNHIKTGHDTEKLRDRIVAGQEEFPKFTGKLKEPGRATRAEWDWTERVGKARLKDIEAVSPRMIDTDSGSNAQDAVEDKIERERLYRVAQKRWGAKAAKYLHALYEGHTKQAAASQAGISRPTGDKILKELRTTYLKQNPSD